MNDKKFPVLSINLAADKERYIKQAEALQLEDIQHIRVPAVRGSALPGLMLDRVPGAKTGEAGTVGCFLSHVKCWESIVNSGFHSAVILEDDAVPMPSFANSLRDLTRVGRELVFVNNRMTPLDVSSPEHTVTVEEAILSRAALNQIACGGDGYLLTQRGAVRLLEIVSDKGCYGDVDWFLLYCTLGDAGRKNVQKNPTFYRKLGFFSDKYFLETASLTGAVATNALVKHVSKRSSRLTENQIGKS